MIQMHSLMEYLKRMNPQNIIFNAVYNYFISLFSNPTVDVDPRVMSVLVGDQWTRSVFLVSLMILKKADPLQWDGANDRKSFFKEIQV